MTILYPIYFRCSTTRSWNRKIIHLTDGRLDIKDKIKNHMKITMIALFLLMTYSMNSQESLVNQILSHSRNLIHHLLLCYYELFHTVSCMTEWFPGHHWIWRVSGDTVSYWPAGFGGLAWAYVLESYSRLRDGHINSKTLGIPLLGHKMQTDCYNAL